MAGEPLGRPMKAAGQPPLLGMKAGKEPEGGEEGKKGVKDVLIVHCDLAPEALEQRLVEKALTRQHIILSGATTGQDGVERYRAGTEMAPAERVGKAEKKAEVRENLSLADQVAAADKQAAGPAKTISLHFEATQAQLDAVAADLRSHPEVVLGYSVAQHPEGNAKADMFQFGKTLPSMKGAVGGFFARDSKGGYGGAAPSQAEEPSQALPSNLQNQSVAVESADGKKDTVQIQKMRQLPGTANFADSAAAANISQDGSPQPRMPTSMHRKAQAQKPIDAAQAGGTRMAQSSEPVRYQVIFVLRAVDREADASRITAEKAKAESAGAKAAGVKAAPARAGPAKPADSSKPAAAAQPAQAK